MQRIDKLFLEVNGLRKKEVLGLSRRIERKPTGICGGYWNLLMRGWSNEAIDKLILVYTTHFYNSFYRCRFDPNNGGEMSQVEYVRFLKTDGKPK
ncbi:hypothetical protein KSS87_018426 [Heliosperma pusillum]|nr:hypothetical protein KSS87_018426 [Heliosperma pusillum]